MPVTHDLFNSECVSISDKCVKFTADREGRISRGGNSPHSFSMIWVSNQASLMDKINKRSFAFLRQQTAEPK